MLFVFLIVLIALAVLGGIQISPLLFLLLLVVAIVFFYDRRRTRL